MAHRHDHGAGRECRVRRVRAVSCDRKGILRDEQRRTMINGRAAELRPRAWTLAQLALAAAQCRYGPLAVRVPSRGARRSRAVASATSSPAQAPGSSTRRSPPRSRDIERTAFERARARPDADARSRPPRGAAPAARDGARRPRRSAATFDADAVQAAPRRARTRCSRRSQQESAGAPEQVAVGDRHDPHRSSCATRSASARRTSGSPQSARRGAGAGAARRSAGRGSCRTSPRNAGAESAAVAVGHAGLSVVLVLAVLAAAGYHVNRAYQMQRATAARCPRRRRAGAASSLRAERRGTAPLHAAGRAVHRGGARAPARRAEDPRRIVMRALAGRLRNPAPCRCTEEIGRHDRLARVREASRSSRCMVIGRRSSGS